METPRLIIGLQLLNSGYSKKHAMIKHTTWLCDIKTIITIMTAKATLTRHKLLCNNHKLNICITMCIRIIKSNFTAKNLAKCII